MSEELLAEAIKTQASEIENLKKDTTEELGELNFDTFDRLFEELKNKDKNNLGTESAVLSAINSHPEKEKLIKEFKKRYNIDIVTQNDHELPIITAIEIKGDDDDVFDIEEIQEQKETGEKVKIEKLLNKLESSGALEKIPDKLRAGFIKKIIEFQDEVLEGMSLLVFPQEEVISIIKDIKSEFLSENKDEDNETKTKAQVTQKKEIKAEQGEHIEKKKIGKAEIENRLKKHKEQLKTANEALDALDEIIGKTGKRSLEVWQTELNNLTKEEISDEAKEEVQKRIEEAKAKLQKVNLLFTPEQQSKIGIMNVDVNLGAKTEVEKYASVFQAIESAGIFSNEEKKEKLKEVAKALGISESFSHELDNGSDVSKAMIFGSGLDENGENIPYTEKNKLQIREGITAYPKQGELIMEAKLFGGRTLKFKTKLWDSNLSEKINMVIVMYLAENKGLTGVTHNQDSFATQGGGVIDLDGAGLINDKTSKFTKSVFRNYVGGLADDVDQRLITADEMKSIDWAFQWFHKGQGDITGADGGAEQNDSLSSDDGMKDLGILNKNGVFQQDIMEAALLFIQDQKVGGEPDFYSLQKHLHEFFPDKVPLTGKNKPIEGSEDSEDIDL